MAVFKTQIQVSLIDGEQVERVDHRIKLVDRRHVDRGAVTYIDPSARTVFVFIVESGLEIVVGGFVQAVSVHQLVELVCRSFQNEFYLRFVGISFQGK